MRGSLHTQIKLIFLGFLLLVISAVLASFSVIQMQRTDAAVINLAGRQRMLTQQMLRLALTTPESPELSGAIDRFNRTHWALLAGGETLDGAGRVVSLPGATNPNIQARLNEANQSWAMFRKQLRVQADPHVLTDLSNQLLSQLDQAVDAFESEAQLRVVRLQRLQVAFLIVAFLLLAWSYLVTHRRIIQPLAALDAAASRLGQGDLRNPIETGNKDEIGRLASTFDIMRAEIAAAQGLLEVRVAQRTLELTTAFEFSQEIVSRLDLDRLLKSVTNRARLLMCAESAALCLLSPDGEFLEMVSSNNGLANYQGQQQPVGRELPLRVVGNGQVTHTNASCADCGYLHAQGRGSCLAAPIRIGGQSLGALCVVRGGDEPFSSEESRAITLLANAAAIAIQNARLADARQRQAEENAAHLERERLAADLHDNLAQTLGFLNLRAERVETLIAAGQTTAGVTELNGIRSTIQAAYAQVRAALIGLRQQREERDILQALHSCLEEFQERTGFQPEVDLSDPARLQLDPVVQKQAVYVIREALHNIWRHAGATRVRLSVSCTSDCARFVIQDNGRGFDPAAVNSQDHLGLTIMKARAERSNGRLGIQSTPHTGTRIEATFPLRQPQNSHP